MQGLTTDKVNDNTNPQQTNVVLEGSVELTVSAVASGYRGTVTVELPIDTDYAGLDIEAWARWRQNDAPNYTLNHFKMPYSYSTSGGDYAGGGWVGVTQSVKNSIYTIFFGIQENDAILDDTVTIYYRLITNKINPNGLDWTS